MLNQSTHSNNRNYGLDVVRALAIVLVVLGHGTTFFPATAKTLGIGGYLGVEMFFVLSGYLIGSILLKTISGPDFSIQSLKAFWLRRWFRTLPNYYLFMALQLVIGMVAVKFLSATFDLRHFIFIQHLTAFSGYPMPESWSLCVEEWFYILFPVVLFTLCRCFSNRKLASLGAVWLFLIIVAGARILISFWYFRSAPITMLEWNIYFRGATLLRLDAIAYGVFLAYLVKYRLSLANKCRNIQLGAAVAILLVVIYRYQNAVARNSATIFEQAFLLPLTSVSFVFLVSWFRNVHGHGQVARLVTYISTISYSVYLMHFSLAIPFARRIGKIMDSSWCAYFVYWLASFVGAAIVYKFFESRCTRLRERFAPEANIEIQPGNPVQLVAFQK